MCHQVYLSICTTIVPEQTQAKWTRKNEVGVAEDIIESR